LKLPLPFVPLSLLGVFCGFFVASSLLLKSQPVASQMPAQSHVPQWQIDAGGKQQFDVISVKPNKSKDPAYGNFPLGPGDSYPPLGGLIMDTNLPLYSYISFAYRLTGSQNQLLLQQFTQLPKWVTTERFDIQARGAGNSTKDQMRLMMQSLLADRFKLIAHYETRQLSVFAVVPVKRGKTGPQLKPHANNPPCAPSPVPTGGPNPPSFDNGLPNICGGIFRLQPANVQASLGRVTVGGRNVTMEMIVNGMIGSVGYGGANGIDRPVIDQTGLTGTFDFTFGFAPQPIVVQPSGAVVPGISPGPTFVEALKEQLGLKLVAQRGAVDIFVIDHIEEPTPN
jgi:uncharacterized protein (TIGR03435 family)